MMLKLPHPSETLYRLSVVKAVYVATSQLLQLPET